MIDVALPNGQSARFRDPLMRGDIREVRRGMVFVTSPDGSRRTDGAFLDDLTGRLIARMLVEWSLGPRPGDAQGDHLQQRILDNLDSETYSALEAAVGPWVNRIISIGRTTTQVMHTGSGETLDVADPAQAQRLLESGDFTAIETPGAGPKSIGTGTTSSGSPDGQTSPE